MTFLERQNAFMDAWKGLEEQYGCTVMALVNQEQLGDALLLRPKLMCVPLPDWQESSPDDHSSGNGPQLSLVRGTEDDRGER